MHYGIQNRVYRANINDFRHPTWTYHKVFEKISQKCGKNEGENYFFPTLVFDSKTRSQFRPACKNWREISKNEVRSPPPLYGNVDIPLYYVRHKAEQDKKIVYIVYISILSKYIYRLTKYKHEQILGFQRLDYYNI